MQILAGVLGGDARGGTWWEVRYRLKIIDTACFHVRRLDSFFQRHMKPGYLVGRIGFLRDQKRLDGGFGTLCHRQ